MCLDLEMSAGDLNLLHVSLQLGDGENDTACLLLMFMFISDFNVFSISNLCLDS